MTEDRVYRAALIMDYDEVESVFSEKLEPENPDRRLDLVYIYRKIRKQYGLIEPESFILAADLTRHQNRLAGFEKIANLVNTRIDEAENEQISSKNRFFTSNAVLLMSFEVGKLVETQPLDLFIFVSSDPFMASTAFRIRNTYQKQVHFILPDEEKGKLLSRWFSTSPLRQFVPIVRRSMEPPKEQKKETVHPLEKQSARMLEILMQLRRTFATAVPQSLLLALLYPENEQKILDYARSNEMIDLWDTERGIACVSSTSERMAGKVVKMHTKAVLDEAGQILVMINELSRKSGQPISRSELRKAIKDRLKFSNAQVKEWIELIYDNKLMVDGISHTKAWDSDVVIQMIREKELNS